MLFDRYRPTYPTMRSSTVTIGVWRRVIISQINIYTKARASYLPYKSLFLPMAQNRTGLPTCQLQEKERKTMVRSGAERWDQGD